ncbi:MAG TPA: YedE family putative selenium transporter, partial [Allocoleopsis sp.]
MNFKQFLTSNRWILLTGILLGTLGALAVNWGNPPNMGICAACFVRDTAGALHLHQNPLVQYIRPEMIGFVLGAFGTSLAVGEWRSRGGSSPLLRFVLGAFVMIGVLVFLGCPLRVGLRIAGGDLNGVIALAGFVTGIGSGTFFLRRGFSLGSSATQKVAMGLIMPLMAIGLLILLVSHPAFIAFSTTGPGAQHVPWLLGLGLGLLVGSMVQRTRFCSIGAWRDLFLVKDFQLFSGVVAFLLAALLTNYLAGNFNSTGLGYHWGFTHQPIALPMTHWTEYVWTFLSLALVGLAGTFLEGCPLRNLIRAGEGDSDATITVLGYFAGAAIAHTLPIASSPAGLGHWAPMSVLLGIGFCLVLGFLSLEKTPSQAQPQNLMAAGDGIITFSDVASAMKAEKAIQAGGYEVKL